MSYNKNTINLSVIDGAISVLKNLKISYKITILGEIRGLGSNDEIFEEDIKGIIHSAQRYYKIRKLEYKDKIILEKMIRNIINDDYILSCEYKKGSEPKDWKIEEINNQGEKNV